MSIIGSLPNNIVNGQLEDAGPVMADFNWIVNQVNANAAPLATTPQLNTNNTFSGTNSGSPAISIANYPIASQVQNDAFNWCGAATGTANALTLTPTLTPAALAAGQRWVFTVLATNTGAVQANVAGLGLITVNKRTSGGLSALVAGDLVIGMEHQITYDGTEYILDYARTYSQGASVATAATVNLDTATGDYLHLTGTTTVTAITLAQGEERVLVADGAFVLTSNAVIITVTGASIPVGVGDTFSVRGEAAGVVRVIWYQRVSGASLAAQVLRDYIAGYTMSTAGGSATMTVAPGTAADKTNVVNISLAASIGKTTANWVVGSGNGGLDTGAISNATWYHFYVIARPDTGVVDVIFSLSASAPTFPANYTVARRIGSGLTDGAGHWTAFLQVGNWFRWVTPVTTANGVSYTPTYISLTLGSPTGISCRAFGKIQAGSGGSVVQLRPVGAADGPALLTTNPLGYGASTGNMTSAWTEVTDTNANVQISGNTTIGTSITTEGWYDNRGTEL